MKDRLFILWVSLQFERVQVLLGIAALLAALDVSFWLAASRSGGTLDVGWWTWVDPFLSVATFAAAASVWFFEAYQGWEDSLEKRLCVVFFHEGRAVLRCDHAPLFGESDIRQFAMQIGAQMTGSRDLNFSLDIQRFPPTIEKNSAGTFKRYVVAFALDAEKPIQWALESDRKNRAACEELLALSAARKFRYWPKAKRPASPEMETKDYADWPPLPPLASAGGDTTAAGTGPPVAEGASAHTTNA